MPKKKGTRAKSIQRSNKLRADNPELEKIVRRSHLNPKIVPLKVQQAELRAKRAAAAKADAAEKAAKRKEAAKKKPLTQRSTVMDRFDQERRSGVRRRKSL